MIDLPHQPTSGEPIEILLIEDDSVDVPLIQEAFKTTECEVDLNTVTDGEEALELLTQQRAEKSTSPPDLTILDLDLLEKEEYITLKTIRDSTQFQCFPLIILTESKVSREIAECYGVHANAYLPKPTDSDELPSVGEAVEQFWIEQVQLPPILE